jgi:MarR family transcriptional repressor of emrRAB
MNTSDHPNVLDTPISPQIQKLEANLEKLHARIPELPVTGIMLCRLLLHLGRRVSTMFEQQLKPLGLAEAEFRVLTTLYSQNQGVANPSELCERTSQSPANMSRISDALVARGLITRVSSIEDRRKMVLSITAHGESFVQQLLPTLFGPLRELLADFSDEEQLQLVSQLKRFGSKLDDAMTYRVAERTA